MVNKNRLIKEFCKYVEIDSVSFQERKIADVLTEELRALGFVVKEDQAGDFYGGNCGNLYGYLKGELKGDPILFSAHMDTVEPGNGKKAIVHEDGTITNNGDTVLGADDISGIVSILEAIRTIREKAIPHRSIEVLFTIAEEKYLKGSEVFDYTTILSKEAYVLDLSGEVGTAALKAPTLIAFTVEILGKASHAGFAPELGIHSIATAAKGISAIKQGHIGEDTTVNIGTIAGGVATNIIPDRCTIQGEVRSLTHDKALEEIRKIEDVFKMSTIEDKADYKFSYSIQSIAYCVEEHHLVVERFRKVCIELGIESQMVSTFGGSDNNNFLQNKITGIVLSCGMNQVHSCQEYSHVDDLEKCSNIVLKLMTSEV